MNAKEGIISSNSKKKLCFLFFYTLANYAYYYLFHEKQMETVTALNKLLVPLVYIKTTETNGIYFIWFQVIQQKFILLQQNYNYPQFKLNFIWFQVPSKEETILSQFHDDYTIWCSRNSNFLLHYIFWYVYIFLFVNYF